ncbi:PQQ-binding-like beta-propeller repeat protein [Streptomyces sp. IMTB 2501]|uniref:PQQ-binding-like beta-propeller repeat protein n=1 Tax=Streptomyces sp. IMTB 2501 TaxID=1776340 RepID=UPI0035327108
MHLRRAFPIGTAAKFVVPATDGGRVYVGTRDGHLVAFGTAGATGAAPPTGGTGGGTGGTGSGTGGTGSGTGGTGGWTGGGSSGGTGGTGGGTGGCLPCEESKHGS